MTWSQFMFLVYEVEKRGVTVVCRNNIHKDTERRLQESQWGNPSTRSRGALGWKMMEIKNSSHPVVY